MKRHRRGGKVAFAELVSAILGPAIVIASPLRAQEPSHAHGGEAHRLGSVSFPNSGSPVAQEPFLRGIAFLHSFEYADASDAFREAQAADSTFALAFWGDALTNTQLLWGVDDAAEARAALARLAPTPAARLELAGTPGERAFGAAVEAFYADGETAARARAFADSMRALAVREPDDQEFAAFASLAIQMALSEGAYPKEESTGLREEAIALADRVFRVNPDHPGAAHYLIHAYDDPVLAPRGLDAARAYATIAPDAEHALHMPSHIFLQVGLWQDVASSNEAAWAASRAWVARRGVSTTELDFHSLEWLQYAYLQQGRYRLAEAVVDTARAVLAGVDLTEGEYVDPMYVVGRLEFALASATGRWDAWAAEPIPAAPAESSPDFARARSFARIAGYQSAAAAATRGDPGSAEASAAELRAEAAGGSSSGLLPLQLEALAAGARADSEAMLESLHAAAEVEAGLPAYGPPSYLPTHELLGAALLEAGRSAEAVTAYEAALSRRPNRSDALLGLARARAAAGDAAGSADAYRQLAENWSGADPDLVALEEVRGGT